MERKIAIVGLGYVGLPVAVAFGKEHHVIGFDINNHRIETLLQGIDYTNEVSSEDLQTADIEFTCNPSSLTELILLSWLYLLQLMSISNQILPL